MSGVFNCTGVPRVWSIRVHMKSIPFGFQAVYFGTELRFSELSVEILIVIKAASHKGINIISMIPKIDRYLYRNMDFF